VRWFAVGLSVALLAWNNLVHLLPGAAAAYVPLNLAATAAITAAARRSGLSASDLGLRRDRLGAGARWGGAFAAVVAGALAVAWAVPALHPLLDDARVRRLPPGAVAYHALVRIPLGTVVLEELAFRGALPAVLARRWSTVRAYVLASLLFGFWHVLPAWSLGDVNPVADDVLGDGWAGQAAGVGLAVVGTFVGGLLLCFLRHVSGSLLAPALAHLATNSLGYTFAWFITQR
jgi:uncharacterized protein